MAYVIVRHPVRDYTVWKDGFDAAHAMRKAAGEIGYRIFQVDGDPRHVVALFEWDTLDRARAFFANPELRDSMVAAGVTEAPAFFFVEEVAQGTT